MEKKLLVLIIILIVVFALFCLDLGYRYFMGQSNSSPAAISEAKAIEMIENHFPELKEYSSDKTSLKIIRTEKADDGWYVSFIQESSGAQITDARCYWVKNNNKAFRKDYTPQDPDFIGEFSPDQCKLVKSESGN